MHRILATDRNPPDPLCYQYISRNVAALSPPPGPLYRYTARMRRVIILLLLLLLPGQAIWAAAEPYCQHDNSSQSDTSHARVAAHEHHGIGDDHHGDPDSSNGATIADHDHHCCSMALMMPAAAGLPGALPKADLVAESIPHYRSFDASRIERPKWKISS